VFEPIFRNTVNVGGTPASLITLGLGFLGMVIGAWWFRRRLEIEPQTHNFRATAPDRPNWLLRAGLGLGFVAFALVAIFAPR